MTSEEAIKFLKLDKENRGKCFISDAIDVAIKALEQEPKSEWTHDHEILRAYADGANNVLDKIKTEIENDWQLKKYPSSPFSCGLRRAIEIIDKYKTENEPQESDKWVNFADDLIPIIDKAESEE